MAHPSLSPPYSISFGSPEQRVENIEIQFRSMPHTPGWRLNATQGSFITLDHDFILVDDDGSASAAGLKITKVIYKERAEPRDISVVRGRVSGGSY
jgi:hypothetical protein